MDWRTSGRGCGLIKGSGEPVHENDESNDTDVHDDQDSTRNIGHITGGIGCGRQHRRSPEQS